MPIRHLFRATLLLALLLLASCGNKGPLVKPGTPTQGASTATP